MSGCITVKLNLFGACRAFADIPELAVTLPVGSGLPQLRDAIKAALYDNAGSDNMALIDESALADENEILPEHSVLMQDVTLAILPPVCGG